MRQQVDFSSSEEILKLDTREHPYWNTLEYCWHFRVARRSVKPSYWAARVRLKTGTYRQKKLAKIDVLDPEHVSYHGAETGA